MAKQAIQIRTQEEIGLSRRAGALARADLAVVLGQIEQVEVVGVAPVDALAQVDDLLASLGF